MPPPESTDPPTPGLTQIIETLDRAAPDERIDLDSYHPSRSLKAKITPTADGGTEFYFPPVRAAAQAVGQTVVFVISLSIWVLYGTVPAPAMVFWAAWGIIELLFFLWILRLWFAPERVVIGNGVVSDTYGIFGKTRTMPMAHVAEIHAVHGGYTKHSAILIKDGGLHLFLVGDGIRDRRDAEWLALQMSRAANVKASTVAHSLAAEPVAEMLEQVQVLNDAARAAGLGPMTQQTDAIIKGGVSSPQTSERRAPRSELMSVISAVATVLIFWTSMRWNMAHTIYLNDSDNGRSIHVPVGDKLHLALMISSATGTYWTVANDSKLLKGCGYSWPKNNQPNVQEVEVLCFSAKKKGSDYLRLESRPPSHQEDTGEPYVYTLNVTIE